MAKKIGFLLVMLALLLFVSTGCFSNGGSDDTNDLSVTYELVPSGTLDSELHAWFEEVYETEGLHIHSVSGDQYVLISAGEKPTGGYELLVTNVVGFVDEIEIYVELMTPAKETPVTEALTYPHVLLRIIEDDRDVVLESFVNIELGVEEVVLKDSGMYVGQIDNNSIEVRISGVQPEELAYKAFRLSEEVKDELLLLEEGDQVYLEYQLNEHMQPVIMHISKISQ